MDVSARREGQVQVALDSTEVFTLPGETWNSKQYTFQVQGIRHLRIEGNLYGGSTTFFLTGKRLKADGKVGLLDGRKTLKSSTELAKLIPGTLLALLEEIHFFDSPITRPL